jgi:catechol 2,3-dioxygenase-like lactoylglutathione lyase family enzyme
MSATATEVTRFHVGLHVSDLARSERFYQLLLGVRPHRRLDDQVRFVLDRPPLVLGLYHSPQAPGGALNHVGLRLPDSASLVEVQRRLEEAGIATQRQEGVECCYARQTKFWVTDPDRVLWEIYTLHEDIDHSGFDDPPAPAAPAPEKVWEHRLTEPLPVRLDRADNSLDEVRLEGTFNLRLPAEQVRRLLGEAHRVLRPGGRICVHGLVASQAFPGAPSLPGLASMVQHIPVETEPLAALEQAGFAGLCFEKLGDIHCFQVGGVELREMRLAGWKQAEEQGESCQVVYKGPFAEVTDADGLVLRRGERTTVSRARAERLRQGPGGEQFAILPEGGSASCGC